MRIVPAQLLASADRITATTTQEELRGGKRLLSMPLQAVGSLSLI